MSSGSAQTNLPITFGQPFRSGDLSTSQGLSAQDSAGNTVPVQMDEVSTHANGSVRFAVLSASVPSLPANTARLINFYPAAKTSPSVSVPADPAWNLQVTAKLADGSTLVANPQQQLKQQIASGTNRRLYGPVASEFTVVAPMVNQATGAAHPHLVARLHTRLYQSGQIRTDVVMENNWALKASPSDLSYSLTVTANGQTLLSQPSFTHHHHARWHKVVWNNGAAPNVRLRHNMRYFLDSRATWNYNLGLTIPETVLAAEASNLAKTNTGPMGTAMLTTNMPGTGGRAEIAPVPRWTAMYLVSQDDRARASMLANADAAASAPVHYRDEATDQPISVIKYPGIALRYGSSSPAVPTASTSSVWTPDIAHQGSYAYIPYLVTGDAFYLDEMMFWAAWNVAANDPYYRQQGKGLLMPEQVRGQTWGARSLAEAAFATPDNHPMNGYFDTMLSNNMAWFLDTYGPGKSGPLFSPMGALISQYNNNQSPSYESDFFATVMSWLTENNVPNASAVLNSVGRMQIDRFLATSQTAGFCTSRAAGYWLQTMNGSSYVNTWADFYKLNYGTATCGTTAQPNDPAYPDWAGGYAAVARGMLAAAKNAGATNASTAQARWVQFTPNLDPDFKNDPSYAIVPR
ncbi:MULTISPECIES: hypothetical protein [unclassified Hydrogenophaga]|uniref:RIFT barrel domain-containing protein n=1 Tax=unclassified Hydrogenophaga TaxID=2610897 RepID=UPI001585E010|nr:MULTISPECIES: hypothetical protein [unclassified Hydrogenophaga]MBN9371664.1 hypothetical protein [Hydrogenophaga sp.]